MEIRQNETHITFEVTKNDKVYTFIIPVDSPFNDVFGVLFECVNKVNDFVVDARVREALAKNATAPKEEVSQEVEAVLDNTITDTTESK